MSSKKEEERNEKIIRGLMKLPPNRRCINCNNLGPQYVCTNFWTFVCIACSGIHREFTHRVKSVSMAKFTTQEVEALQNGGNQRAREQFLKDWDTQRMRLPDNSNPVKIREFIKSVYVDKKYAGSRSSDKPSRDTQSLKGEEDHRRASSYHSFSQSPPYDNQYEERRYGRPAGLLTKKPGSDHGHYEGKMSSFLDSPGCQAEQIFEDRFANEGSGSRMSDYSVSSDPFRYGVRSPNFNDPGFVSPPSQVRDILVDDPRPQNLGASSESVVKEDIHRIPHAHRSASSGTFGSSERNSISVKSANSSSLIDSVLELTHASVIQQADTSTFPYLPQKSSATNTNNVDLFNPEFVQSQNTSLAPSIDLFAEVNRLPSTMLPKGQKSTEIPPSDNVGWATFDLPHHAVPPAEQDALKGDVDLFSFTSNNSDWFSDQNLDSHGLSSLLADQGSMGLNEVKDQLWSASFPDSAGNIPQILSGIPPQHSESQDMLQRSPGSVDPFVGFKAPESMFNGGFLNQAIGDKAPSVSTLTDMASSSFPPSTIPQMGLTTLDRKSSNPFDLLYDSEPEANNMFMDTSSLQAALPEPHLQLPAQWFPTDSLSSFIPPVPQGGLAYIGDQLPSPQLQNVPSQGPIAWVGGNPFA